MQRKGLILGAVLAVAGALGLGVWLANGDGDRSGRASASDSGERRERRSRMGSFGSESFDRDDTSDRPSPSAAHPPAPMPVLPTRPPLGEQPAQGEESEEALRTPRFDPGAARSSGWRLGRARAQITLVESRLESLRGRAEAFQRQGNQELADRQRLAVQRFENRLTQLREEAVTLEQQATADGTIGEVDLGIQENTFPERPAVNSPRAPGN